MRNSPTCEIEGCGPNQLCNSLTFECQCQSGFVPDLSREDLVCTQTCETMQCGPNEVCNPQVDLNFKSFSF